MYKVRYRELEKKNWKTIAEFETANEAKTYAIKLDLKWRRDFEKMDRRIDIVYPTINGVKGCRFIVK